MKHKKYVVNAIKFHKEGMSINDACDKAYMVELVGRKKSEYLLKQYKKDMLTFFRVIRNYIMLNDELKKDLVVK